MHAADWLEGRLLSKALQFLRFREDAGRPKHMQNHISSDGLSVVSVHKLSFQRGWSASMHAHADAEELVFISDGEAMLRAEEKVYHGAPGTIFAYPRALPHAEASERSQVEMYCLTWRYRDPNLRRELPLNGFDQSGRIRSTLEWMSEVSSADSRDRQQVLDGLMHGILHELQRPRAAADVRMLRVRAHVAAHLGGSLRLGELAEVAGMSPFHFAHQFKKSTGLPPAQFVREQRIEAARRLLLTTSMPLRAIAPRTGFADEHELSRVFRRLTGSTPSAIRAAARLGRA
jgi:AraC-like DNA-binding protein/quercetin dioxygenase-like cupin family protein